MGRNTPISRNLVIGASGGIGRAVVTHLQERGEEVVALSRRDDGLDLLDMATIDRALAKVDGECDRVFIATGALMIDDIAPEKTLRALDPDVLQRHFAVNATGPIMVLQRVLHLLPRDRRAVIAILSARVGSIGDNRLGGWYSYRAAKAALNQLVHTAAIELGRTHPQAICVTLHPGTVETPLTANFAGYAKTTPAEAAANLIRVTNSLQPGDSGGFFDWSGQPVPW